MSEWRLGKVLRLLVKGRTQEGGLEGLLQTASPADFQVGQAQTF